MISAILYWVASVLISLWIFAEINDEIDIACLLKAVFLGWLVWPTGIYHLLVEKYHWDGVLWRRKK